MALVLYDSTGAGSRRNARPNPRRYVLVYGTKRTTVFLPEDLESALAAVAAAAGCSEADLICEGIRLVVTRRASPTDKLE